MTIKSIKPLLVAVFSIFFFASSNLCLANEDGHGEEKKGLFDANEVIFAHVLDAYQFHFFSYKSADGEEHHISIPLPVILYSPQRGGLKVFMS